MAKRRAAALRRKLDFPQASARGEQNLAFAIQAMENQLQQVLTWIACPRGQQIPTRGRDRGPGRWRL